MQSIDSIAIYRLYFLFLLNRTKPVHINNYNSVAAAICKQSRKFKQERRNLKWHAEMHMKLTNQNEAKYAADLARADYVVVNDQSDFAYQYFKGRNY